MSLFIIQLSEPLKSPPPWKGNSGNQCEIIQSQNDSYISCVRIAPCCLGAFLSPVPFPAASVSAAHSPNIETEVNMASVRARKEIAICKRRFLVLFGNGVYFAGMF